MRKVCIHKEGGGARAEEETLPAQGRIHTQQLNANQQKDDSFAEPQMRQELLHLSRATIQRQ
jgi:hypothetical protein